VNQRGICKKSPLTRQENYAQKLINQNSQLKFMSVISYQEKQNFENFLQEMLTSDWIYLA